MAWRKINDDWQDFYPYVLPQQAENDDDPVAVELAVGDGNCAFKACVLIIIPKLIKVVVQQFIEICELTSVKVHFSNRDRFFAVFSKKNTFENPIVVTSGQLQTGSDRT